MKYSLRSLMIGVTLFCVLLGGRIEYLRRRSVFHEQKANLHLAAIQRASGLSEEKAARFAELAMDYNPDPNSVRELNIEPGRRFSVAEADLRGVVHHRRVAEQFRRAIYRPWSWTHESETPW